MKFRYIGAEAQPGSGRSVVFGDIDVAVGGEFECPAHLVHKAKNNPFFEAVVETVEPDVHDEPVTKAEAVAFAEQAGLAVDKRWSVARIIKELEVKASADGQAYDVEARIKADRVKV